MENEMLDRIDEIMVNVLTKSDKPLTVYKIAKEAKLSWATVNTHCYKMKSQGILKDITYDAGPGQKRTLWGLSAKTPTLDEFISNV